MRVGQVIETSNGWFLEVQDIKWWNDDDGAVYGRMFNGKRWSREKYIGTVTGIQQAAVGIRFAKQKQS